MLLQLRKIIILSSLIMNAAFAASPSWTTTPNPPGIPLGESTSLPGASVAGAAFPSGYSQVNGQWQWTAGYKTNTINNGDGSVTSWSTGYWQCLLFNTSGGCLNWSWTPLSSTTYTPPSNPPSGTSGGSVVTPPGQTGAPPGV